MSRRRGLEEAWLRVRPEQDDKVGERTRGIRRRGTRTASLSLRFEVLRRDDFRCRYCGRQPPEVMLHLDHVEPWSAGGRTVLENLRAACSDCNLGKGARRPTNLEGLWQGPRTTS
jgi:5-methylcytosine-specific restriction endonuclease McrA